MTIEAHHLHFHYESETVINDLSLAIIPGEITALVGPNGSGKSTLLKALARILRPQRGEVLLEGKPIQSWSARAVARRLALLPQSPEAPMGLSVRDLAGYGRHPWRQAFQGSAPGDRATVDRALALAGMTSFADRMLGSLSGGQRQRAWIAMALSQDTDILMLDEPTSFLDMAHQVELMQLVERLNAEEGRTIVIVLHDLNQAARIAHRMVVLNQGSIAADGKPAEVMTAQMLRQVFGVESDVILDPRRGTPLCLPYAAYSGGPDFGS
ncbi:ABC transporter ATP-binding protein [Halomonas sp. LS-001]